MPIWVTRSAPDNLRTARALRGLGRKSLMIPALTTCSLPQPVIRSLPDAIVFTSIHSVRHHRRHDQLFCVPVFAASGAVADAAVAAGYVTVTSTGDERALPLLMNHVLPPAAHVLILAATRTSPTLADRLSKSGHRVESHSVYEPAPARERSLERATQCLDRVTGIVLHSKYAAEQIAPVLREHDWSGSIWCISDHTATGVAALQHVSLRVAAHPSEGALLELIAASAPSSNGARASRPLPQADDALARLAVRPRTPLKAAYNDNDPSWPSPGNGSPAA